MHSQAGRVSRLASALSVSRRGYYAWRARGESERTRRDRELLAHIGRVHAASRQAYGAKKTWPELKARGIACGQHRVARLRREAGIEARRKRRFRVITEHHHSAPPAPNLAGRRFRDEKMGSVLYFMASVFKPECRPPK